MSQAKRQRRQSIRGSHAAAKQKRRTTRRSAEMTIPTSFDRNLDDDLHLGFLASGAGDALRRVARSLDRDRTADDEDDEIGDYETEFEGLADHLAQLDELLMGQLDLRLPTGDGHLLLTTFEAERERLGDRTFDRGEVGVHPFDALDRSGRIRVLSTDLDQAVEVVGLMVARGTEWDPFEAPSSRLN